MKNLKIGFKLFLVLSIFTGFIYPAILTAYAKFFAEYKSNGSLILSQGVVIGSEWIGQKFTAESYFWGRPSAVDYNSATSGGSNLGMTSQDLIQQVRLRKQNLLQFNKSGVDNPIVPSDLLFASASGLDPHISPQAALFQVERVANARKIAQEQVRNLVNQLTDDRQFGILGEPRVNVLSLNLALDRLGSANLTK